jgi:hypothetical protein
MPAVAVFDPLSRRGVSSNWAARWQTRRYGSPFAVFTYTVNATAEEITEAIRRVCCTRRLQRTSASNVGRLIAWPSGSRHVRIPRVDSASLDG